MRIWERLRAKLGDFWFYSLMIFCACRVADAMNVFVGLWLVPKYVEPAELGAVMPLTQFASFLALPAAILATTFMKEVNTLATRGEYGKMKTLIRGVFIGVGVALVLSVLVSKLALPLFLERIRVANGSLGFVIIASAFIGCASPVYVNALQALKRFKAISLMNVVGAPLRLVTMLVAMPFRPLTGYFVGQAATPAFNMVASVFLLRRELAVKAAPYWNRRAVAKVSAFMFGLLVYQGMGAVAGLVEQTILRQRLPELDSAAYYMVTRFSEITCFLSGTLLTIMFPYTAELAAQGKDTRPLVVKSSVAMLLFSSALALGFWLFGKPLLKMLPNGELYAQYFWAIPWMIGIATLQSFQGFHTNTEISAGRFGFLKWWVPVHAAYAVLLLAVTGHGYFRGIIPAAWTRFLTAHNIDSLSAILWCFTAIAVIRLAFCGVAYFRQGDAPIWGRNGQRPSAYNHTPHT